MGEVFDEALRVPDRAVALSVGIVGRGVSLEGLSADELIVLQHRPDGEVLVGLYVVGLVLLAAGEHGAGVSHDNDYDLHYRGRLANSRGPS